MNALTDSAAARQILVFGSLDMDLGVRVPRTPDGDAFGSGPDPAVTH